MSDSDDATARLDALEVRVAYQDTVNAGHLFGDGNSRVFVRDLAGIDLARSQVFFNAHVH